MHPYSFNRCFSLMKRPFPVLLGFLILVGPLVGGNPGDAVWGLRFKFSPGAEAASVAGSGSALSAGLEGLYQRDMGEWGRFPWGLSFTAGLARTSISETFLDQSSFEVTSTTVSGHGGLFLDLLQKGRWTLRSAGGPVGMLLKTDVNYYGNGDSSSEFKVGLALESVAAFQVNARLGLTGGLHYVTHPTASTASLSVSHKGLSYSLGGRYRF